MTYLISVRMPVHLPERTWVDDDMRSSDRCEGPNRAIRNAYLAAGRLDRLLLEHAVRHTARGGRVSRRRLLRGALLCEDRAEDKLFVIGDVRDRLCRDLEVLPEHVSWRVREPVCQSEGLVLGRFAVVEDLGKRTSLIMAESDVRERDNARGGIHSRLQAPGASAGRLGRRTIDRPSRHLPQSSGLHSRCP